MDNKIFKTECSCSQIKVTMIGEPRVSGYCHCNDCRELLNIPYHSVNAWEKNNVSIVDDNGYLLEFQHPRLQMKKFFCKQCGDIICNSNAMDWRIFSQLLIKKFYGGDLPDELKSKSHFFYRYRIVDVADDLPKKN